MPSFKAALFDFDGVVVDSTTVHLDGWAAAYQSLFKSAIEPELRLTLVGRSTAAIGGILAEKSGFPSAKSELVRRKSQFVFNHLEHIPLIAGIGHFFDRLTQAGIPYGVVSNAPRSFLAAALAQHGLPCPFALGLEDYVRPKPDPEPYVKGARRLAWKFTEHARIAVFEDSTHGIKAALGAHMTAIGVCSQHPAAILQAAGATHCIDNFLELDFLEKHFFV